MSEIKPIALDLAVLIHFALLLVTNFTIALCASAFDLRYIARIVMM